MARFVAVVGSKKSGKTALIQQIVPILKNRGYHVATIKEMSCTQMLETPESIVELVIACPQNETALLFRKKLSLNELVPFLNDIDYVILEGFENEKLFAKIIVANTADEVTSFSDGLAIAISGNIANCRSDFAHLSLKIPVINGTLDADKIVDVIEQKTFTLLPNLVGCATCHSVGECGYATCYEYAKAIISGESEAFGCPLDLRDNVAVEINGVKLPLKDFPQTIIRNSLIGMFSSLHGVDDIRTLKIEIRNNKK